VDTQGDALFYAFASAAEAAAAAEEAQRTGDHQRAARLLGASQELRVTSGGALEPSEQRLHERTAAAVERALSSDAMSSAWAEGRALTLDEALALALAAVD